MVYFIRYTEDAEVKLIIRKPRELPFLKSMCVFLLVESKTSGHSKNKSIKYYDQTG